MTIYPPEAGELYGTSGMGAAGPAGSSAWAVGWIAFAGVIMVMIGIFQVIAGIVGIADDKILLVAKDYAFSLDTTTWGWIHLVLGIVVALAGFGVFTGNILARSVGVLIAALSAIANFMWIPYYPVWSIIMIALAVTVIWALTAHGRDMIRTLE